MGTQNGLMINPSQFRSHIKPMFKKKFMRCRKGETHVFLSSDGCLLEIIDELVECGVSLHDPQIRANTLEGIFGAYNGKVCAQVDLDQQKILPFGRPREIDKHVREIIERLKFPKGGLMIYGETQQVYPLRNIQALFKALERYCLADKKI